MDIPIILKLNSIKNPIEVQTTGIAIQHNKKKYIVTVHQGLSVEKIIISTDKIYEFTNFIVCGWNDLILIPIDNIPNLFVFKQFVKKQINVSSKYNIDSEHCKYISNDFLPINMIPGNPSNLYYKMSTSYVIKEGDCGKPVYNNNNLVGIIGKIEDTILYIIPSIYIIKSCEKVDNSSIYTLNDMNIIERINRYKVVNKSIYYIKINSLIPVDTYIALEGDKNNIFIIASGNTTRSISIPFINNYIGNSMNLEIDDLCIRVNSCFIHMMKICYNDTDLIKTIFTREDNTRFEYKINDTMYYLSYL
jgi:hypothetical protein